MLTLVLRNPDPPKLATTEDLKAKRRKISSPRVQNGTPNPGGDAHFCAEERKPHSVRSRNPARAKVGHQPKSTKSLYRASCATDFTHMRATVVCSVPTVFSSRPTTWRKEEAEGKFRTDSEKAFLFGFPYPPAHTERLSRPTPWTIANLVQKLHSNVRCSSSPNLIVSSSHLSSFQGSHCSSHSHESRCHCSTPPFSSNSASWRLASHECGRFCS